MSEHWIIDASPLITLAKIGEHRLLTDGAEDVLIPEAVAEEVLVGSLDDPRDSSWRPVLDGSSAPNRFHRAF